MMKITFLGTGDAKQVPVWGCDCKACIRARVMSNCQRKSSCILLELDGANYLLDAGSHNIVNQFQPHDISGVILTHFHVDHLVGLFQMRWGTGKSIPVFCPRDKQGCADLYKNSGLFRFEPFKKIFTPIVINPKQPNLTVSAVPLNHSKETLGYCIEADGCKVAYLCDTKGLPSETEQYLLDWRPDHIIVDCTFAPNSDEETQNHNSFDDVLDIRQRFIDYGIDARYSLTHIAHDMDVYLMNQWAELPLDMTVAEDNQVIELGSDTDFNVAVG
jgi:phosphoribosyl 1,2-cyclic phosphate phosphodiesterase